MRPLTCVAIPLKVVKHARPWLAVVIISGGAQDVCGHAGLCKKLRQAPCLAHHSIADCWLLYEPRHFLRAGSAPAGLFSSRAPRRAHRTPPALTSFVNTTIWKPSR